MTGEGRCASQAWILGRQWKTCIREAGHTADEPHVWLEAFTVVGRRPILVTWFGPRTTEPTVSTVWVPAAPGANPGALVPGEDDRPQPIDGGV